MATATAPRGVTRPARGTTRNAGTKPAAASDEQIGEIAECAVDVERWITSHVTIEDPQADGVSVIPFALWECQRTLVWTLVAYRQVLILKARQLGISWLVCAYVLWLCLYNDGRMVLLFSKGQSEANDLLKRVLGIYHRLPEWMRWGLPTLTKVTSSELQWANGSRIESQPATQNAGRSFTASLVVMDEAAFMMWGSELYTALKPTIDAGGQLIILSTANGIGNLFHKLWMRAHQGIGRFKTVFIPWHARPGRTQAWYEAVTAEFDDPMKAQQEYPATADEAFIVSGRPRFHTQWVDAQQQHERAPLTAGALRRLCSYVDDEGQQQSEIPERLRAAGDALSVWTLPEGRTPVGPRYVIGVDVAEGVDPGDWSHADVLNRYTWEQVACLHRSCEPDQFGEELADLAEWYDAQIGVERNNHGHVVIAILKRRCPSRIMKGHDKKLGWLTTIQTKPQIIDRVAQALRDDLVKIRDAFTRAELRIYQLLANGNTSAPSGYFDDRVMSLAIGLEMATHPMTTSQAVAGGERPLVQAYTPR